MGGGGVTCVHQTCIFHPVDIDSCCDYVIHTISRLSDLNLNESTCRLGVYCYIQSRIFMEEIFLNSKMKRKLFCGF